MTRLGAIMVLHKRPLKEKISKGVLILPDMLNIQCTSLGTLCMVTGSLLGFQRVSKGAHARTGEGLTGVTNTPKSKTLYYFEPAHGLA